MRNHRFLFLLAGSLALGQAGGLGAQDPVLVPIGTRVRVFAPSISASVITGTVQGLRAGNVLSLKLDGSRTVRNLSLASVERFEVSQGKNRGRGALIGLGLGAGFGAIVGYVAGGNTCDRNTGDTFADLFCVEFDRSQVAAVLGVVGGLLGAGLGALFAGDRWGEVAVDRVRVAVGPQHGSLLALSASISF